MCPSTACCHFSQQRQMAFHRIARATAIALTGYLLVASVVRAKKTCPCRSSGLSVFVDDSAESVVSVYGEAFDLVGSKGLGEGLQGCGGE